MKRAVVMALAAMVVGMVVGGVALAQAGVQRLPRGFWRAWLESPGGELPFVMEFYEEGDGRSVAILNGPERIVIPNVVFEHSEVVIAFPHYDSEIRARFADEQQRLEGTWTKTSRDGKTISMAFQAVAGERRRWPEAGAAAAGVDVAGRWRMSFEESGDAVGELRAGDEEGTVVGTVMTPSGDYGFLAGVVDGRTVRLSNFDGSHAFLFTAQVEEDGALVGEFWSGPSWHEVWAAEKDPEAAIVDGFAQVGWNASVDPWTLEFVDERGETVTVEEALGGRSGLVMEMMGTWCPNCADAAAMINRARLEIPDTQMTRVVGIAFEYTDDRERSLRQIAAFKKRHHITYPILLGGVAKKDAVMAAMQGLTDVRGYPTTIFARRDGRVIGVHVGFSGPATGVEHERLREKMMRLMVEAGQR